jgi:hypothetical protein
MFQAEIEYHFDRKNFILLPVHRAEGGFSLKAMVLYRDLLKETFKISPHSKGKEKQQEKKKEKQHEKRHFNYSWSDLDGLVSSHVFSETSKPFLRLIAQHSFCAIRKAMKSGNAREINFADLQEETIELARLSLTGDVELEGCMRFNNLDCFKVKVDDDIKDDEKGDEEDDMDEKYDEDK